MQFEKAGPRAAAPNGFDLQRYPGYWSRPLIAWNLAFVCCPLRAGILTDQVGIDARIPGREGGRHVRDLSFTLEILPLPPR